MRIAIIADPIDNQKGGVHVYTREFVHHLIAINIDHELILIREKIDPQLTGVRQIAIPNMRIGLGLAAMRLFFIVPIILWWNKVDLVFEPAHFGPFNLPKHIKRVTMIHDLTPFLLSDFHRYHSQLLQKWFLKGILRRADLIIANSRHTQKDIVSMFPFTLKKVAFIHLGCDPGIHRKTHIDCLEGLVSPMKYWLCVGTIEPRKNLNRVLEAFGRYRLITKGDCKLVVVGEKGWKATSFFKQLEKHPFRNDIILTGYVPTDQLSALYSFSKGLIYPSFYEGFGLPVLEALNCGCPVICSGVSSLPEVGGKLALYIDPNSTNDIIEAMHQIDGWSLEKRRTYIDEAFLWTQQFSWEFHAKSWIQLIHQIDHIHPEGTFKNNQNIIDYPTANTGRMEKLSSLTKTDL